MGSPKGKQKGSKTSKDSKSKSKSKEPQTPPVEDEMQTDPCTVCYLCGITFYDSADLQAHTMLIHHGPNLALKCNQCHETMEAKWCPTHRCNMQKALFLNTITSPHSIKNGAPFRCLFCRSRPFASRSDLVVHLLGFHNSNRKPGHCGLCAFSFEEPEPVKVDIPSPLANLNEEAVYQHQAMVKAATDLKMCQFESADLGPGMVALDEHLTKAHACYYGLVARDRIKKNSELRKPYACVLCGCICNNNHEFHAHILCRHGIDACIKSDLCVCGMCGAGVGTPDNFVVHCKFHSKELEHLSKVWIDNELMQNSVSCGEVCTICWETFKTDYDLQAHTIVAHTGSGNPLICGWCGEDFSSISNPVFAFQVLINHEKNHARTLHATALEFKTTTLALPDLLPEEVSEEAMHAAEAAALGDAENSKSSKPGKKGKSSDKAKSKSKRK